LLSALQKIQFKVVDEGLISFWRSRGWRIRRCVNLLRRCFMFAVLASTPEVFTGNMGFSPGAVKALGAPLPDGTV